MLSSKQFIARIVATMHCLLCACAIDSQARIVSNQNLATFNQTGKLLHLIRSRVASPRATKPIRVDIERAEWIPDVKRVDLIRGSLNNLVARNKRYLYRKTRLDNFLGVSTMGGDAKLDSTDDEMQDSNGYDSDWAQHDPSEKILEPSDLVSDLMYSSGQVGQASDCSLRKFKFIAQKDDSQGAACWAEIQISICSGSCFTSEYPDYRVPYKRTEHVSCNPVGQLERRVFLSTCSHPDVDPMLREYHYYEPQACQCKECSMNDTICMTT